MIGLATTRIDVFRDLSADTPEDDAARNEWGDEVETPRPDTDADPDLDPDPFIRDEPASIIERTRRFPDPTTGDFRTVRYLVGRVTGGVDVSTGDIIVDRKTGDRYSVTGWSEVQSPVMRLDRRLDLERTS